MADEVETAAPQAPDVTTQPAVSTEEAAETDVELSPVGDEKVVVTDPIETVTTEIPDGDVQVRSASARELDIRIMPWNTQIETLRGAEEFSRGAFAGTDPTRVFLMEMNHEARIGLDNNGQPKLVRRPVGRGLTLEERDDAAYMTFKVASTPAGDEVLALAADGIVTGASVETLDIPGGYIHQTRGGRRVRVNQRVALTGVSTTYRPAYKEAGVVAMRSEGVTGMTETAEVPVAGADNAAITAALASIEARGVAQQLILDKLQERDEQHAEQFRSEVTIPGVSEPDVPSMGRWAETVLKLLTGDRIAESQMRQLDDVITSDNAGVVPPAYLTELIGVIDNSRPFLSTTRRLPVPDSGMSIIVPVINQRPTAGVQDPEKEEVSSQKTLIGTTTFNGITIAGAGDLSIQVIKRSSPSFLNLWIELLAEAYAIEAEDQAIQALFDATGGVGAGNALNPNSLSLGAAYMASFDAIRRPPDTIWLSTEAVAEFIDAKATTTNQPLYPGLAASATAAGGITGVISGLKPVHVPTLDAHGAYAIVGPSSGFAWAEEGTFTLQVDVPAKAGRDVALVGILWPMPWYPAAFTSWNVAS
jgi:HK97 family phage prohead protease